MIIKEIFTIFWAKYLYYKVCTKQFMVLKNSSTLLDTYDDEDDTQ